jgi:hypothetical protein
MTVIVYVINDTILFYKRSIQMNNIIKLKQYSLSSKFFKLALIVFIMCCSCFTHNNEYVLNARERSVVKLYDTFNNRDDVPENPFENEEGTEDDPYKITSVDDLRYFAETINNGMDDYADKYLKLMNDIDLVDVTWQPIGSATDTERSVTYFSGNLDGNNKVISNLSLSYTDSIPNSIGLFDTIDNASIKNLILENCSIYSEDNNSHDMSLGILAGTAYDSTIENCSINNSHIIINNNVNDYSFDVYVGGLVGNLNTISAIYRAGQSDPHTNIIANCYIRNCKVLMNSAKYIAGLVGNAINADIHGCHTDNSGININNNVVCIAGLIAHTEDTTVQKCYSECNVRANYVVYDAAALIGYTELTEVENCYASGDVRVIKSLNADQGDDDYSVVSGLVGYAESSSTINNCCATGHVYLKEVGADNTKVSGLVGFLSSNSSVDNSYYDREVRIKEYKSFGY